MRDRMPAELLARARGQAAATNRLNKLAKEAGGYGTGGRLKQREAEAALIKEMGARRARKLIRSTATKIVRDTF